MATAAITDHFKMVDQQFRRPGLGRVTACTLIGGGDVGQVLTRDDGAIVTTETGAQHFIVVGGQGRCPLHRGVTGRARIG